MSLIYLQTLILSLIQGFSEFIPVSSSAHLVLFSDIFQNYKSSVLLDASLHFGSLIAIIHYFFRELIDFSVSGAIEQARIARDIAGKKAPIHINILWEMAAAEEILTRTLEEASDIIDGVTCGAGMPYKLSDIAAKYGIFYYPIVSSARAFNALWKRSYRKTSEFLGGVVYVVGCWLICFCLWLCL